MICEDRILFQMVHRKFFKSDRNCIIGGLMPFQIAWMGSIYAIMFSIGGLLVENGNILWSMVFFILFPLVRIARRFQEGKGYYVIGYMGQVGGDMRRPGGLISRKKRPAEFQFYLFIEILIIVFLLISAIAKITDFNKILQL